MKNLRMFEVKYIGPSSVRGSRIKIRDTRHEKSVTLSYDYEKNGRMDQAADFLASKGIPITGHAWDEKTGLTYLLSEDFATQIK